jgi:hypothetical protein
MAATATSIEVSVVDILEFKLLLEAITSILQRADTGESIPADDPAIVELRFAAKTFSRQQEV